LTTSKKNTKTIVTTILLLLMVSAVLTTIPVHAQYGFGDWPNPVNQKPNGSVPLPAGVTADVNLDTHICLSFRPNPVGAGQTVLVNMWMDPPVSVTRYLSGFKVTITNPNGDKTTKTLDSYQGDSTAWFEFVPDKIGTWTLKFEFPGGYFPPGNYTMPAGSSRTGFTESYEKSCYYRPSTTQEQTLVVQENLVWSWPSSPLPTDYWTRPVMFENREWWSILGAYPWNGPGGGPTWPADTTEYWNGRLNFVPYTQAPNTAHIAWKRQGAMSGIIGGGMGLEALTSGGGNPNIIFMGRAYQSVSKVNPTGTGSQNYWQCYDIRTGQLFWERPIYSGESAPTAIEYDYGSSSVPGATAQAGSSVSLVSIANGRLVKYNPLTGAVNMNVSISPLTTSTYYMNGWALGVQIISNTGNENKSEHAGGTGTAGSATAGIYRLVNWTTMGSSSTFASRMVSNISWPRNNIGDFQDFKTGIAFVTREVNFFDLANMGYPYVDIYYDNASGVRLGNRMKAYNLNTGAVMWDVSVEETQYSGSACIADHGKVTVAMRNGYLMTWDQFTGKLLYKTENLEYPWDWQGFGAYAIASAYGMFYRFAYGAIYAFDWDTGEIVWKYKAVANPYETPYVDENGLPVYSWNAGGIVADGKLYIYNTEHTPTAPITRGWGVHCINALTGEGIWSMWTPGQSVVADGYLSVSSSDGYQYVYGKGKTATTVTASPKTVAKGASVLIEGTVLDQSPAQPNTPCVSKESMVTQMQYLHKQQPVDGMWHNETVNGVPVALTAIGTDGTVVDIGVVTTNGYYGTFSKTWTPPKEDTYTITASFAADDSYGSSAAATALSVGPATAATGNTQQQEIVIPDYTLTIVGAAIAIIIALAIAVLLLKKK